MLTAASHVLTLDVLWIINNKVAVPHYREIHRQLTDLHPLVQILEAEGSETERKKDTKIREEDFNERFWNSPFP